MLYCRSMPETSAYCVKCRAKRDMAGARKVSFESTGGRERLALQGKCPVCETKMFKILSGKDTAA